MFCLFSWKRGGRPANWERRTMAWSANAICCQCWTAPYSMWLLFLSIFSFSGAVTLTGQKNVLENKPMTLTCKYTSAFTLEWLRNSRSFISCIVTSSCSSLSGYKSTINQTTSVLHIESVTIADSCWKCKPDRVKSPELCLNVEKLGHNITLSGKTLDPDSLTAWIDCSNPYYKNVVCYYKNKTTTKEFDHVISKPVSKCSSPTFKKTLVTINVTAQQLLSSRNYSAYCKATFGGSEANQTLTSNEITFWIAGSIKETGHCDSWCIAFSTITAVFGVFLIIATAIFFLTSTIHLFYVFVYHCMFLAMFIIGVSGLAFTLGGITAGAIVLVGALLLGGVDLYFVITSCKKRKVYSKICPDSKKNRLNLNKENADVENKPKAEGDKPTTESNRKLDQLGERPLPRRPDAAGTDSHSMRD